jgi:adenine-specific DNA-methyltransferase
MNIKQPVPTLTPDLVTNRLRILREHFPEAFTEDRVDFEKLCAALGDVIETGPERYSFTWAGKR